MKVLLVANRQTSVSFIGEYMELVLGKNDLICVSK